MNRAVFLDRDGVINRKAPGDDYIETWEQLTILPGVVEAVRTLNEAGYRVLVVTNQRGVAKGIIPISELDRIHRQMQRTLALSGATIHAVYYCPHDLESSCKCRKPEPGMLIRAAKDFEIDTCLSWMIGDSVRDIRAGQRAGCRTVLINNSPNGDDAHAMADIVAEDLRQAVHMIVELDRTSSPNASTAREGLRSRSRSRSRTKGQDELGGPQTKS
jgi:D-glycero-D-manno-heptose 1,7-bisphosphate phosphatase